MTMDEAGKQYEIPDNVLEEYECLCEKQKSEIGVWECTEQDLEYLSLMVTLHQIGFVPGEVKKYMKLVLQGKETAQVRLAMLNRERGKSMEEIHLCEGRVDLLDYLRYELQKEFNE